MSGGITVFVTAVAVVLGALLIPHRSRWGRGRAPEKEDGDVDGKGAGPTDEYYRQKARALKNEAAHKDLSTRR